MDKLGQLLLDGSHWFWGVYLIGFIALLWIALGVVSG